jgi:hypothetical protein
MSWNEKENKGSGVKKFSCLLRFSKFLARSDRKHTCEKCTHTHNLLSMREGGRADAAVGERENLSDISFNISLSLLCERQYFSLADVE